MSKRFFVIFLFPFFVITSFAVELGEESIYSLFPDTYFEQLPDELPMQQSPVIQYFASPFSSLDPADLPAIDVETYALEPITPAGTSGLKSVLLSVLGNYESIVTDYRYQNASGNWQYLREIQPDYVWICSAGIFALLLWCVFRMAGGFFCRK